MGLWSRIKSVFAPPQPRSARPRDGTEPAAAGALAGAPTLADDGAPRYAEPIARERDLEASIAADPGAPGPYLVYGDWLQERGDPRGELIAIQHALRATTDPDEHARLAEREDALLARHRDYLAGPARVDGYEIVDYYLGFARTLSIFRGEGIRTLRQVLEADHPALRFVRRIAVPRGSVAQVAELVAELGRSVTVVDEYARLFDPDLVRNVSAALAIETAGDCSTIRIVVADAPFAAADGYSYIARTTFGDDVWWHGSGSALTEELMCDDPMHSGTAYLSAVDGSRALCVELRARIPAGETTHTLWFRGSAACATSGPLLLVRCAPCTGAPFDVPAPAIASPRRGPALITDPGRASAKTGAAVPGLGVYDCAAHVIVTERERIAVAAPEPDDAYPDGAYGGAARALVLVRARRGGTGGSWLATLRGAEPRARLELAATVYSGAVDPSGRWFAALVYSRRSRLVVYELDSGRNLGEVDAPATTELAAHGVGWSGTAAYAIGDGAVACFDAASGAASELAVPRMIGYGWRQYGAGIPAYHLGIGRSARMMCAEFPDASAGDAVGTTIISWRDRGGPYRQTVVPDHGWAAEAEQFGTVVILDDGRIVAIGTRVWVVDPETGIASDHGEAGSYAATPVLATVDGRVRLYQHGGGPWWIELSEVVS